MVELVGKVSERGIRRSEVRFLMGNLGVFLCPTFVARRKVSFSILIKFSFVKDIYIYIYIYFTFYTIARTDRLL